MKKQLLFTLAVSMAIGVTAQNFQTTVTGKTVLKVSPAVANQSAPAKPLLNDGDAPSFQTYVNKLQHNNNAGVDRTATRNVIGKSIYDLQTNASICNRIVLNADGTIGATWSMSREATATPSNDRGTGYNYFNSTWGTAPTTRLESARVGWPNIGVTGSGGEIVVTHEALTSGGTGDIYVERRTVKGTGAWTETKMGITDTWPRMVVGGQNKNTIHLISQTSGAAPPKAPFMGQDGALTYSRSLDGGATWDKLHTVIPAIGSTFYLGFGGDNYAMDAKGDTIVIVAGGKDVDVVMIKSIDNGNNWTKTVINKFPIAMFDAVTMVTDTGTTPDGNIDTLETNDGGLAVLLDNQGKAHIWYGRSRVFCAVPGTAATDGLRFLTFTDGLMYWNENMGSAKPVMITSATDIDNDGLLSVFAIGTYYVSLTGMPSAGIDAQGNIYVTYSGIFEGVNDDGQGVGSGNPLPPTSGKSYRHTYVMRSDDGGTTWCDPHDITDPDIASTNYDYIEGVFGAMAKRVDGNVHVIAQEDSAPGHGLSGTPAGSVDTQTGNESDIVYYKIPVTDIACAVGINENKQVLSNVSLYPNPATTSVTLSFSVTKSANANVVIYNAMGQKTAEFSNELNVAGTHNLTINTANYKPGIYFVNSTIDGKIISKKLVVE